jgi:hypothetical protein
MLASKSQIKIIGRREFIDFPLLGISTIEAKIDTGAYTSAIHCDEITVIKNSNGKDILIFKLSPTETHECDSFSKKIIKNSFGEMEERYVIKTIIHIGKKKINTIISLTNRDNMRYPVLIGRRAIKGKFLVDVSLVHTNGIKPSNYNKHL